MSKLFKYIKYLMLGFNTIFFTVSVIGMTNAANFTIEILYGFSIVLYTVTGLGWLYLIVEAKNA